MMSMRIFRFRHDHRFHGIRHLSTTSKANPDPLGVW
jgi:hypothetical protein